MKAAVHDRYGPPDVVHVKEVEKPTPGDNELLVKVHATTVTRKDCGYRRASPFILRFWTGLLRPKRTILGTEFAGEVEAAGHSVTSFSVGDRVFGYVEGLFGAHAQYLTIPEDGSLVAIPADLTYEEAAPATEGSHYALSSLTNAKVRREQDVLVNGGTGAIGSAAVQLLTSLGSASPPSATRPTWSWSGAWALTRSSTTRSRTSLRTTSGTTSSSMPSARARYAAADAC